MKVTARTTRTSGWWAVEVPEVPGVFTQAKRLDQVEGMVRDAVALMEDVTPESIEVVIVPALPASIEADLQEVKALLGQASKLQQTASAAMRHVVQELRVDEGLSVRDVGVLLGVSPQRVSQILPMQSRSGKVIGGVRHR